VAQVSAIHSLRWVGAGRKKIFLPPAIPSRFFACLIEGPYCAAVYNKKIGDRERVAVQPSGRREKVGIRQARFPFVVFRHWRGQAQTAAPRSLRTAGGGHGGGALSDLRAPAQPAQSGPSGAIYYANNPGQRLRATFASEFLHAERGRFAHRFAIGRQWRAQRDPICRGQLQLHRAGERRQRLSGDAGLHTHDWSARLRLIGRAVQFAFPPDGGSGEVRVNAAAGCAWTAASDDAFITITLGATVDQKNISCDQQFPLSFSPV